MPALKYDKTFFKLSRDTHELAKVMNAAVGRTSSYKSENCEGITSSATAGKYQSVARIDYQTDDGSPAVKFVRVYTNDQMASESSIFNLSNGAFANKADVHRTLVHGPTKEDLSNLIDKQSCSDWARAGSAISGVTAVKAVGATK